MKCYEVELNGKTFYQLAHNEREVEYTYYPYYGQECNIKLVDPPALRIFKVKCYFKTVFLMEKSITELVNIIDEDELGLVSEIKFLKEATSYNVIYPPHHEIPDDLFNIEEANL